MTELIPGTPPAPEPTGTSDNPGQGRGLRPSGRQDLRSCCPRPAGVPAQALAPAENSIEPRSVTAFIGPSGCGKSTLLRTLNRMHELVAKGRVEGKVCMDGTTSTAPGSTR